MVNRFVLGSAVKAAAVAYRCDTTGTVTNIARTFSALHQQPSLVTPNHRHLYRLAVAAVAEDAAGGVDVVDVAHAGVARTMLPWRTLLMPNKPMKWP
eukprot:COSAG01_NODE_841_length_13175_cov_26.426124_9_plen_97_part_00